MLASIPKCKLPSICGFCWSPAHNSLFFNPLHPPDFSQPSSTALLLPPSRGALLEKEWNHLPASQETPAIHIFRTCNSEVRKILRKREKTGQFVGGTTRLGLTRVRKFFLLAYRPLRANPRGCWGKMQIPRCTAAGGGVLGERRLSERWWWRRWELNPRPKDSLDQRLQACRPVGVSSFGRQAAGPTSGTSRRICRRGALRRSTLA